MSDLLTTLTRLFNSPPGQLAAGGVLAGITWKFFERVEAVLTEETKLEIARWLRVKSFETGFVTSEPANWPATFAKVFDRLFGAKHLSWKCLCRSSIASLSVTIVSFVIASGAQILLDWRFLLTFSLLVVFTNVLPDYPSLLKTRHMIEWMSRSDNTILRSLMLLGDAVASFLLSLCAIAGVIALLRLGEGRTMMTITNIIEMSTSFFRPDAGLLRPLVFPAFFTSIWLWLYAGSGFLLKAARRFDIGFDWFNRKFDIEKKPLQSIGLVAGALVAVTYWTAVIVSRVL